MGYGMSGLGSVNRVSMEKSTYSLNKTVRIFVDAENDTLTYLEVIDPNGLIYVSLEVNGSVTHQYVPEYPGVYSVTCFFSLENKIKTQNLSFTVLDCLETQKDQNASAINAIVLSLRETRGVFIEKGLYLRGEPVVLDVDVPKETSVVLQVTDPEKYIYEDLKTELGPFNQTYIPRKAGKYEVFAGFKLGATCCLEEYSGTRLLMKLSKTRLEYYYTVEKDLYYRRTS